MTIGEAVSSIRRLFGSGFVHQLRAIRREQREQRIIIERIDKAVEVPDDPPPSDEFMAALETIVVQLEALGGVSPINPSE